MNKPLPHLEDEHMSLYEWSGGIAPCSPPADASRPRYWLAPGGVPAVLAPLLVLTGCGKPGPTDQAGGAPAPVLEGASPHSGPLYKGADGISLPQD